MASVTPRRTVRPFEGRGTAPAAEFADEAADQNHDVGPGSLWLHGAQDAPDRIELGNEQDFLFGFAWPVRNAIAAALCSWRELARRHRVAGMEGLFIRSPHVRILAKMNSHSDSI